MNLDLFQLLPNQAYYNTLPISGKELVNANDTANKQDQIVLLIFSENPFVTFTRDEMYTRIQAKGRTILVSSVGRSLTTLMNKGFLEKTTERRKGFYAFQTAYKFKSNNNVEN